jgi:purine-nucleoside phosphorylase
MLTRRSTRLEPRLAIVLGSGFHGVAGEVRVEARLPYAKLPGFPPVGVSGHSGELIFGALGGVPVAILSGRSHYYEGRGMEDVTFGIRMLAAFGIKDLLLTNAAGGINRKFRAGDLMLITDHINLMGMNPLRGPAVPGLPRFVDMTATYDPALRGLVKKAARAISLKLRSGVYLAVSGPSYETPAEIRAFSRLGADAVGMSTVPEAIVARQCGLNVAGLSCITNLAAGRSKAPLSHSEVLETGERVKVTAARLLVSFAELYGKR